MRFRTWLQGAGVAALVLFPFYRSLLDMPGYLRMHTPGSVTPLAVSVIINLVLVSLVGMLVGAWLRNTSRWCRLKLVVPALVLATVAEMVYMARTGWESTRLWLVVLSGIALLTFLLRWRWRQGQQMLIQLSSAVLIGLGFFWIFVLMQVLHLATWRQLPNSTSQANTEGTSRAGRPRIVWILFDELSYRQSFGDRYQNLQLPNFDEFRKSSTLFANTQPIINDTEKAIPSMFLGRAIMRVNYTTSNQLQVGGATGPLYPFNAARTTFALARQQGLTTGVVGWYNPYCSMLAPYLNQCYWTFALDEPRSLAKTEFWQDLGLPWIRYGMFFRHPTQTLSKNYRAHLVIDLMAPAIGERMFNPNDRIRIYKDLMAHALRLLGPSGPDLVFVHLPLPHPPGFYNRKTQQFDISGDRSYIDNLALADKALGQLLAILRQSPRWRDTNVVVCGDHSWRVYMWSGFRYWTPEDEAASHGGVFDPRPLLMVHLAGQTTPATVNEPFPLLKVHDILDDLVTGKKPVFPSH